MAEKLWLVSLGAQEDNIRKYCFDECGQILIGALDLGGGIFLPCKTADCPHLEKSLDFGVFDLAEEGERELIIRKLVECEGR